MPSLRDIVAFIGVVAVVMLCIGLLAYRWIKEEND